MEQLSASKFKATCLSVLKRVKKTRKPVRITRFGKVLAEIVPPTEAQSPMQWFGCMKGTAKIVGNIVGPAVEVSDWDALKE